MKIRMARSGLVLATALAAGCDYGGDFLFSKNSIDDIWILNDPDGNRLVPADITSYDQLKANTIYGEVGAPQTTGYGGVTFDFIGTGDDVCLWVDPEVAYWDESVAPRPTAGADKWAYPDNVFDDGDMDLLAGQSVYYTGSPGEAIGDFVVEYKDSLGNTVPISLANCPNAQSVWDVTVSSGRGSPEFCTIPATQVGIGYTALLRTWSTPLDDDRLSFGVIIANGACSNLQTLAAASNPAADECVIQGEAITPEGNDYGPWYGFDELNKAGRVWPGSIDFEKAFCDPAQTMKKWCKDEADSMLKSGHACDWQSQPDGNTRCYCGDPNDSPAIGAI